jgi:tetratricopeptide (TPR) repeat protein
VAPATGTGLQRSMLWQTAWEAATTRRALDVGAGRVDRFHAWRMIVGYGPDTIEFVIRRYISPALVATYNGIYLTADHLHSDSWDTLLGEGALGLVARELLFLCVYLYAMVSLRIAPRSRQHSFWGCVVAGAFLGGLALARWQGPGFFWLGWRCGSVLGLLVFMSAVALPEPDNIRHPWSLDMTLLVAALLGAAIGHSIEIAFSFAVGTTAAYFWIYTGVLIAAARLVGQADAAMTASQPLSIATPGRARNTRSARRDRDRPPHGMWARRDEIVGGGVIALVMLNLGFELLRKGPDTAPVTIVVNALTRVPATNNQFSLWIAGIVVASGLLFAIAWTTAHRSADPQSWSTTLGVVVLVAFGLTAISWGVVAFHLASMRPLLSEAIDLASVFDDYTTLTVLYYGFTVAFVAIVAAALAAPFGANSPVRRNGFVLAATVASVTGIAAAGLYFGNLRWSRASVTAARADRFKSRNDWSAVRAVYEHAVATAPSVDQYRVLLGNAILQQALATADAAHRQRHFDAAETVLVAGYAHRPLNTGYAANLGDLYLNRAVQESNPQARRARAVRAADYFRELAILEPARFDSLNKSAYLAVTFFGQSDAALDQLRRSLKIAPAFDQTMALIGEVYTSKAHAATTSEERTRLFVEAVGAYQSAIARVSRYSYDCALGDIYSEMLDASAAIKAYRKCVDEAPGEVRSTIDEAIARQYLRLGDRNTALTYGRRALAEAPPERQSHLIALIEEISRFPHSK